MSAATKVKDAGKKAKSKVEMVGRDAKGRFKKSVGGAATGDRRMQAEGGADQVSAAVTKTAAKAKAGAAKRAAKAEDSAAKTKSAAKRVAAGARQKATTAK